MIGWQHFEVWEIGTVYILGLDGRSKCLFEIGAISTGKQRVFHRHYISLTLPDGAKLVGEDRHNLRDALVELDQKLRAEGFELQAAGLDPRFYETGLSHNSGLGYIDAIGCVHMMDSITELDGSGDLDALIREAVAGIGNWAVTSDVRKDRRGGAGRSASLFDHGTFKLLHAREEGPHFSLQLLNVRSQDNMSQATRPNAHHGSHISRSIPSD